MKKEIKKITVHVKNQEGLSKDFGSTTIFDYKTVFSKYKIIKDLEDAIIKDLNEHNKVDETYLIDYDTSWDRHCIFILLEEKKISDTEYEFTYEYNTTVSG